MYLPFLYGKNLAFPMDFRPFLRAFPCIFGVGFLFVITARNPSL